MRKSVTPVLVSIPSCKISECDVLSPFGVKFSNWWWSVSSIQRSKERLYHCSGKDFTSFSIKRPYRSVLFTWIKEKDLLTQHIRSEHSLSFLRWDQWKWNSRHLVLHGQALNSHPTPSDINHCRYLTDPHKGIPIDKCVKNEHQLLPCPILLSTTPQSLRLLHVD